MTEYKIPYSKLNFSNLLALWAKIEADTGLRIGYLKMLTILNKIEPTISMGYAKKEGQEADSLQIITYTDVEVINEALKLSDTMYTEFIEKKASLLKSLLDLKLQYVYSQTTLRVGDTVKFIKKGDSYIGEKDKKYKEKIYDFEVSGSDLIFAKCESNQSPDIRECKKV